MDGQDEWASTHRDRVAGALVGTAVGDALGVHYEFGKPPGVGERAEMLGGGLGDYEPGEWSDDTSMAVVVAQAVASAASVGGDASSQPALDRIADGFVHWHRSDPPDIGLQTAQVLSRVRERLDAGEEGPARIASEEAVSYAMSNPHSAGNGALMRTAPVAWAHLHDRDQLARSARRIAQLTHADPLAGDSCVLWSEAIRVAIVEDRTDLGAGLDLLPSRRDTWAAWLGEAMDRGAQDGPVPGRRFSPNGYTVRALQAAVAAIASTEERSQQFEEALHAAIRIGDDTDTVAAIAGGFLGARWGLRAIPDRWRQVVHGWPGLDLADLQSLSEF